MGGSSARMLGRGPVVGCIAAGREPMCVPEGRWRAGSRCLGAPSVPCPSCPYTSPTSRRPHGRAGQSDPPTPTRVQRAHLDDPVDHHRIVGHRHLALPPLCTWRYGARKQGGSASAARHARGPAEGRLAAQRTCSANAAGGPLASHSQQCRRGSSTGEGGQQAAGTAARLTLLGCSSAAAACKLELSWLPPAVVPHLQHQRLCSKSGVPGRGGSAVRPRLGPVEGAAARKWGCCECCCRCTHCCRRCLVPQGSIRSTGQAGPATLPLAPSPTRTHLVSGDLNPSHRPRLAVVAQGERGARPQGLQGEGRAAAREEESIEFSSGGWVRRGKMPVAQSSRTVRSMAVP